MSTSRAAVFGLLPLLFLAACQSDVLKKESRSPAMAEWAQHYLPNAPQPYDKLLVEIDAVEGAGPTAGELKELRTFLAHAVDKPGGITIKVDQTIPKEVARTHTPERLALRYINGPQDERTAFLYILFYCSKVTGAAHPDNPSFSYYPYPSMIFIDRSYRSLFLSLTGARPLMLRHELGHALGLADSPAHSSDGHCTNAMCLMHPALSFQYSRLLRFRSPWANRALCPDCERDLANYKRETRPDVATWRGYHVRKGEGYRIFALPDLLYVEFGDAKEFPEEKLTAARQALLADSPAETSLFISGNFELPNDVPAFIRFIRKERERHPAVEGFSRVLLEKGLEIAENLKGSDRAVARAIVTDELIDVAGPFPDVQGKLKALQTELGEVAAAAAPPASP